MYKNKQVRSLYVTCDAITEIACNWDSMDRDQTDGRVCAIQSAVMTRCRTGEHAAIELVLGQFQVEPEHEGGQDGRLRLVDERPEAFLQQRQVEGTHLHCGRRIPGVHTPVQASWHTDTLTGAHKH